MLKPALAANISSSFNKTERPIKLIRRNEQINTLALLGVDCFLSMTRVAKNGQSIYIFNVIIKCDIFGVG